MVCLRSGDPPPKEGIICGSPVKTRHKKRQLQNRQIQIGRNQTVFQSLGGLSDVPWAIQFGVRLDRGPGFRKPAAFPSQQAVRRGLFLLAVNWLWLQEPEFQNGSLVIKWKHGPTPAVCPSHLIFGATLIFLLMFVFCFFSRRSAVGVGDFFLVLAPRSHVHVPELRVRRRGGSRRPTPPGV